MSNTKRDKPTLFLLSIDDILLIILTTSCCFVSCSSLTDSQILLAFKTSLSNSTALVNWDDRIPPCNWDASNWDGVLCSKGNVLGLQLEEMELKGAVDITILKELKYMRTFSLMNNQLEGPMPDVRQVGGGALRALYLSNNRFAGVIPEDAFDGMASMKKLHLAGNQFTGPIPVSLTRLSRLTELRLEGNKFEGQIPEFFQQMKFESFNVSNNALSGSIPPALKYFDPTSFSGNGGLCGEPLEPCNSPVPAPMPGTGSSPNPSPALSPNASLSTIPLPAIPSLNQDPNNANPGPSSYSPPALPPDDPGSKSSKSTVVIASVTTAASLVAVAAIVAAITAFNRKTKRDSLDLEEPQPSSFRKKSGFKEPSSSGLSSPRSTVAVVGGKRPEIKLTFVRDDVERFDLNDLLKSSAEILGSGCFGSSYKAAISSGGAMMVVKRFKQMNNVGREEFQEHMNNRLGRLRHPNLLPLVAYYYRKEEKLLVHEFVQKRSLAVHLHGRQALGQPSLDWPTRLKIIKGVAKGLQYLYKELPSLIAPHGHLKSSNVLLNESLDPLLADYGLIPVMNQESAQELMVAYKSPEFLQLGRVTKKTDVWGLGVLILEIMTGKFPENSLQQQGKSSKPKEDLSSWVGSVILANNNGGEEKNKNEVFDKDLIIREEEQCSRDSEGEMVKLLKIGLACSEAEVEKRLDLKEAVQRIEEVKERRDIGGDDDD